jgi:hypothetical protein
MASSSSPSADSPRCCKAENEQPRTSTFASPGRRTTSSASRLRCEILNARLKLDSYVEVPIDAALLGRMEIATWRTPSGDVDVLLGIPRDERWEQRMAAKITSLFPGCPTARAEAIARHAAARGSGRVGRSAAGRALDESALKLAVVASVRHRDTAYDDLLMSGMDRGDARERVRDDVARIVASWRAP